MKKILIILTILTLSFLSFKNVKAEKVLDDGKYQVSIDLDLKMGASNFENYVYLEKNHNFYYMTFIVKDKNAIINLELQSKDKIGLMYLEDGNKANYIYTLEQKNLENTFKFRGYVPAMQFDVEFSLKMKLDTAKKLADTIDDLGERPAAYLPTIDSANGELDLALGSYYQITLPKAYLLGEELPVVAEVYYLIDNEKVPVEVEDLRFMLTNIGEYHVIYKAESDKYLTSKLNKTKSIVDIKINAKASITHLAKAKNLEGKETLPINTVVQAISVKSDSEVYKLVTNKLKKKSNNFEIINVNLFDAFGHEINLDEEIYLYLLTNPSYNRNKVEVYHLDSDNELLKLDTRGYGRYMQVKTDEVGNFVIMLPGVPFVMPMWGYAVISIVAVLILASAITIPIVVVKKKKHKSK